MDDIIFLDEIRLQKSIEKAELTLRQARMLVSLGKDVPDDLIPRLEHIIASLEQELIDLIEKK